MSVRGMQIVDVQTDPTQQELTAHGDFSYPLGVYKNAMDQNVLGYVIWHWHDEYQFSYVTKGEIMFYVNSESFLLQEGQGIFINRGCMHSMKPVGAPDSTYVCIDIGEKLFSGFKGSLIEQKYIKLFGHAAILLDLKSDWHENILERLKYIYNLFIEKLYGFEVSICAELMYVLSILIKNNLVEQTDSELASHEEYQKIKKVLSYIHENYVEKISLEDIAQQIYLSRNECCRFFKRKTNTTIFEYLMEHRISKSIELLRSSSHSISQIAVDTGFSTTSYYIESFRKHIGCTPNDYRKRLKSAPS